MPSGGRASLRPTLPAHIVVAEDQADIRDLIVMNLRQAGHEVLAFADGAAALASQAERQSDLLVLDLMMPGLDGLEVTKALRAKDESPGRASWVWPRWRGCNQAWCASWCWWC